MLTRPPTGAIPDTAGSYQFKDRHGRIIYVGKAKNLRSRLGSYFQNPAHLPARTAQMVAQAESVEWIQVDTEVDALLLEHSLIQQHQPRFNVRYRDDKSYPFLCVTMADEWPRAMVIRGRKKKGNRYFGPYGHAYAIRETLDQLLRTFPVRTCSDSKFNHHARLGRPCLLLHIEKCAGPCVGMVERGRYNQMLEDLLAFLDGDTDEVVKRLEGDMAEAAAALEFEQAARCRDRLASVRKAIESQEMVGGRSEDYDVVGLADDELEAACQVFYVRKGRVMGRRGFIVDKAGPIRRPELLGRVLERLYFEDNPLGSPKQVLVPDLPENQALYEEWLRHQRGSRVAISVPQRGAKRKLQETVARNAADAFARHRLKRSTDHNSRARALNDLQRYLGLPEAPLRIECYDMSHFQGSDYVGSMVVMEDGLPRKSEYRRFKVRTVAGNDDGRPGPGRRDLSRRAGQGVRAAVRARPARPGGDSPALGEPVLVAAHPRREPPLRQRLPPPAPGQADDPILAGRDRGPGPRPADSAGEGAGRGAGGGESAARRPAGAGLASRRGGPLRLRETPRSRVTAH